MNTLKVGIITINRNGIHDTIECINSLLHNSYKNSEIILIDNDSKDNEGILLQNEYKNYSNIHVKLNNTNRGFAGGCNDGIKIAQELGCNYFLLFNNDAVAKDGFLERLIEVAESDAKIGCVGPAITYYKSNRLWFAGGVIGEWSGIFRHKRKGKDRKILEGLLPYETEYVTGCCLMIKKTILEDNGLLDEDYFAYFEEADYCYKARKKGWKCIVVPDVVIEHKKSASAGNKGSSKLSSIQANLIARNGILFGKKNLHGFQRQIYLLGRCTTIFIFDSIRNIRDIKIFLCYIKGLNAGFAQ